MSFLTPDADPTPAPNTDPANPAATVIPVHGENPAPTNLPDWLKDVDPEIANDPSLKVFKDQKDLVKSYVHAQKMLGKDKVVLPGKTSTDEDWKQFYNKIGLPESVENYELKKGANYTVHDDALKEFKELAYTANIMPAQAQKVMDWLNERAHMGNQASMDAAEQAAVDGWNALKNEWGNGFDKNISAAKAAIKEFGDDNLFSYFEDKGFTDDPMFARFMAKVGSSLSEDVFVDDVRTVHSMTPNEAKARIGEIQADIKGPYYEQSHPNHKKTVDEVTKLWEIV